MIYSFKCVICGEEFDEFQKINDEHIAFHCGIKADRVYTIPYTNKDLMYQFKTNIFNNRITEIYSKRQYNRLLKENGLMTLTTEELRTMKPKDKGEKKRKETAKRICNRLREGNALKAFPSFAKKYYTRGVKK